MPTQLDNEAVLVRSAQAGCSDSFGVLVNRYEQRIYRLSYAITKNAEDAEDVLQETFLKAYTNIGHFRGESRFYTWLVRIAINEALMKLRRHHASAWVSLDEPLENDEGTSTPKEIEDWRDNPEESYAKTELRAILSKALEDLRTPLRVVFVLRDIEGFSSEETARILGLSITAVKTRLRRARLKLRQRLSVWFENRSVLATRQGRSESVLRCLGPTMTGDGKCILR
jgi:RNA polymerase sigma-70 factor (ECF subfamily)